MIRWKNDDAKRLRQAVNNFNAKVRRLGGAQAVPERESLREIKNNIASRSDLNREIKRLQRFSQRGAEKTVELESGLKITRWEKRELGRQLGIINRKRAKLREQVSEMDVTSQGKAVGLKRGEMGSVRMNELKPRQLDLGKVRSRSELKAVKASLAKQVKSSYVTETAERFKMNYIQGLYNTFGNRAKAMISKISSMNANDIVKKLYSEQEATISFMYDKFEEDVKFDVIENIWLGTNLDTEDFEI